MSGPPDPRAVSFSTAGYADGLGRRSVRFDREVGGMLECLHLRPELRVFEASLRERSEVLRGLDDERFVRIRGIERDAHGLVVVSELIPGQRLADVIDTARMEDGAAFGIDAALGFLLQALPALSALHGLAMAHGSLAPGRLIVTTAGQLVVADAIYGAALDRLRLNRAALWTSLELVAPSAADPIRLDRAADIVQASHVALVLATGRTADGGRPAALSAAFREIVELAEIRSGSEFASSIEQYFAATLPLHGRPPIIGTDDAVWEARRLASLIGEEHCHAAFGELTRFEPTIPKVAVRRAAAVSSMPEPVPAKLPAEARPVANAAPSTPPEPVTLHVQPVAHEPAAPVDAPPTPVTMVAPVAVAVPAPVPVPVAAVPPIAIRPVTLPPAPLAAAPVSTVTGPVASAPVIRLKEDPPSAPSPIVESTFRSLPFVDRGVEPIPSRLPLKLAAAAALVLAVGVAGGRWLLASPDESPIAAVQAAAAAPAPAPATPGEPATIGTMGGLVVDSQPAGARVTLDGAEVGVTPLTLQAVEPGRHTVAVSTDSATVRRTVRVEAGRQARLDIPVYAGWLAVFSPIPLDLSVDGRSIGTSESGKVMLPPGRHLLTLSNREFGFTATRAVEILPGEERPLNVEPRGSVNVNAHPWAEVWVDGQRAGETPIANLQVLLGTRVFVFRHPLFGERRITATITATAAPLTVDLTRPANHP